jgi:hypothetical protein
MIYRKAIRLEIVKRALRISSVFRKTRTWNCGEVGPLETEKEIVHVVRAGQCGITGHFMSYSPHCCVREREKEENLG